MKLYIPTTTLNFNNILSNESISPRSFYKNRGFGYSRWFDIPENNLCNHIALFSSMHKIVREDNDLEDHPLIISIDTDEKYIEVKPGVYITDKTIYLNPWNTEFIFLSEKDKRTTLSISDSSLETKMIKLYQKNFIVCSPEGNFPIIDGITEDNINTENISLDKVLNRLKGFLYGYYIGALLSIDSSKANYYNIFTELQNIFAAVLSNPNRMPSDEQNKRLDALFTSLFYMSSVFKDMEKELNDRDLTLRAFRILDNHRVQYNNINRNQLMQELQYGPIDNNRTIAWIAQQLSSLRREESKTKQLLSSDSHEIVIKKNRLCSIKKNVVNDDDENKLFVGITNHILADDNINGKISAQRAYLADTLTTQAKDILGSEWENSPTRSFMNQLRRHVRGEEFTNTWSNGVLCSLASVILKGDDWETLLGFMKEKGMTDYRLAYAFYGAFNGFANLTRDFTDLLLNNDSSYVASVYKEFHHQLFNKDIDISNQVFDLSFPKDNDVIISQVVAETPSTSISFAQRVLNFFYSNIKKGKSDSELESGLRQALQSIGDNEDGYVFVCVLNDYPKWSARTNAWKKMQAKFCPDYEIRRHPQKSHSNRKENNISNNRNSEVSDSNLGGLFSTEASQKSSQDSNNRESAKSPFNNRH